MTAGRLASDLDIRVMANTVVTEINARQRTIKGSHGVLAYDQLVLAVGASQIPLSLVGEGVKDVLSINSLADYARLRTGLQGKRSVAIIGAGLIGCEFANDLRLGGFDVDVYDQLENPMGRLLPPVAAKRLRNRLEAIGVGFHLETRLESICRDGERQIVVDSQARWRPYDLVISAIGVRPNLALARTATVATGVGIVTDPFLRTSDPHIYALGDCVELDGIFLPYVMPIMKGAMKLATTLCGRPEPVIYPAMPIVLKTPACPTVVSPPPAGRLGHWDIQIAEDGLRALYLDHASGEPTGFVLQDKCTRERVALAAMMPAIRLK